VAFSGRRACVASSENRVIATKPIQLQFSPKALENPFTISKGGGGIGDGGYGKNVTPHFRRIL
jgi:hypothetical protein